jgi:quinone-modifying oxidoreductase subunit QmoC
VWLCHQCNDCSLKCPRGARPGDVLAAVRRHAVQHYAMPSFLARWVSNAKTLPLTFLVPAVLIALVIAARGPLEAAWPFEAHPGFYADFFPHWMLIGFYGSLTTLSFVLMVVALARFWGAMRAADQAEGRYVVASGVAASFVRAVKSILTHERFGMCQAQKPRQVAHLAAFYGFGALFVVTVWATIDMYLMPVFGVEPMYPFGLLHPMKILANVGGVALIYGSTKAMLDRRALGKGVPSSSTFDWTLLWVLLGVGVTGFAAEIFRFTVTPGGAAANTAYAIYFVHLVLVFQLLVYLPYSKFAHVLYRTVAMIYSEHTGRHTPGRPLTLLRPAGAGLNGAERLTARSESSEAHEALTAATR